MPIRALIFDFDGLILDTESPDFWSWQEVYRDHGQELPLSAWASYIGGPSSDFHPFDFLESLVGYSLDREAILGLQKQREQELFAGQQVLAGVEAYLGEARRLGMGLGVASSSPRDWVVNHLSRVGLLERFDAILTRDDVDRVKPDPELYRRTLEALEVIADQAVALEDSPNGVMAAQQAGIFCVAVPNPVTRQLDLSHADLVLNSLAEVPLEVLIQKVK